MADSSFFGELTKRKVFQAAAIYFAIAWGAVEVIVTMTEQLNLPAWVSTLAVIAFVTGFPVTMFLAWTFDLTSEGLQRTTVTSRRGKASIAGAMLLLVTCTLGLFLLIKPREGPAPPPVSENSIVVMPFRYAGADTRYEYLAEGIADELRGLLSRMGDIRVAAHASAVAAQKQHLDAVTISRTLGVAMLLDGNIARQRDRLDISVELIDGRTGLAAWTDSYEIGSNELPRLQDEIAATVASYLLPTDAEIVLQPATRSASASELMHQARYFEQQVRDREIVDERALREAIRLYRDATEADPQSAVAFSRLAAALLIAGDLDAARAAIQTAVVLDPNLSEVQNTLGLLYWVRGQPDAGRAFADAVELDPYNVEALTNLSQWQWFRRTTGGRPDLLERALQHDRLSLSRHAALGMYYAYEGYVDEARDVMAGVLELQDKFNDDPEVFRLMSTMSEKLGEIDRAIAWAIRARDLEPDDPDHTGRLAELYAVIGDFETALELEPEPGIGLLYYQREYQMLIDKAFDLEEQNDVVVLYLVAFAYNATERYSLAKAVLAATGQPDIYLDDTVRLVADIDAFLTLTNALYFDGEREKAREYAEVILTTNRGRSTAWWYHWTHSCALAILGRNDEALLVLRKVDDSPELPRDPDLRDSLCMRLLADAPEYQAVVRRADERRRELRDKLPETLAEYGVAL